MFGKFGLLLIPASGHTAPETVNALNYQGSNRTGVTHLSCCLEEFAALLVNCISDNIGREPWSRGYGRRLTF